MTEVEFAQTKLSFDNGNVAFNHGHNVLAFSYQRQWYPVTAFVNQVRPHLNTYQSVTELLHVRPFLFFKEVNFMGADGLPLALTDEEIKDELKMLAKRIAELVE